MTPLNTVGTTSLEDTQTRHMHADTRTRTCVGLTGEERRGEDDVPHPALAVDLRVEAARHVARHAAGQSVQDDGCRVDGAVAVHIEHPQQRHDNDSCRNDETDQTPAFKVCTYDLCVCMPLSGF